MYSKYNIDINCDVGEGVGNEALLMPYISSCNIACAAHAGDIKTIDNVIRLAKHHNVKIGAHPSFPDKENFGRKIIPISDDALQKSIENQISLLMERTSLQGTTLQHIKLHGALYNLAAIDEKTARIAINAIRNTIKDVVIFVPYKSIISDLAKHEGYGICYETFADRNYNDDLSLVSRKLPNAIISDKDDVLNHILRMITTQTVRSVTGKDMAIKSDTICVHGDHKNVISILTYLQQSLKKRQITIG